MGLASLSVGGFVIHSSFACHAVSLFSCRSAAKEDGEGGTFVPSLFLARFRVMHAIGMIRGQSEAFKKMLTLFQRLT